MEYGYVRVSTSEQNIARQIEEMHNRKIDDSHIFIDYQSGKDFNRANYQKLKKKLRKDDLLVIKSIDRLGRDYNMIIEEWRAITKEIGCDIVVIDMPLLDTRIEGKNLIGKFISDIVLQVLSFVAQNERENIRQRQAEGIKIAKAKKIHMGRPKIQLPEDFFIVADRYRRKEITNNKACEILNVSRGTFFKYIKEPYSKSI